MSYNAILQNSPALNSLKRQQLVKLCKRHALKASGKNVDLIERLKEHGTGLPPEALDYRWELSDGDDEEPNPFLSPGPTAPQQTSLSMSTRPSEQWEIVMDDIAEADENGKKTGSVLRTPDKASEFGTAGFKSATKFSLKTAITNSLGLKRSTARDTDEFTDQPIPGAFDFPDSPSLEPIPGTSAKPGTPAPANARLSFSLPTTTTTTSTNNTNKQPTTTIRLIPSSSTESANLNIPTPPRIAPFKTTFDLEMTPGVERRAVWPASPVPTTQRKDAGGGGGGGRLYPVIPAENLMPTPFKSNFSGVLGTPGAPTPIPALKISPAKSESSFPKPMLADDVFSPAKPSPASVLSKATASQKKDTTETKEKEGLSKPYLFGSPITQPHFEFSPGKMDAATTNVLEEMNKRLAEAGLQKVDKQSLPSVSGNKAGAVRSNQQDRKSGGGGGERFAKAHEEVFNKMDSITNHYAARRPPPPPPPASAGKKRKSEAAGLAHAPTSRKMSVGSVGGGGGVRKKMSVPGGLPSLDGHEDDGGEGGERREGEEGEERSGKRMRVAGDEDVHRGKQPSLSLRKKTEEERKKQEEEEMKRQKKMEATRKHLDAARRRSRSGRASLGVKGVGPSRTFSLSLSLSHPLSARFNSDDDANWGC
ncbi:hypothetical protein BC629DRAFT_366237 [Irpex lacteus]|nr:hypothetical protein BC629DRAFT_366237 [Irpex lacteus]